MPADRKAEAALLADIGAVKKCPNCDGCGITPKGWACTLCHATGRAGPLPSEKSRTVDLRPGPLGEAVEPFDEFTGGINESEVARHSRSCAARASAVNDRTRARWDAEDSISKVDRRDLPGLLLFIGNRIGDKA